MAIYKDGRTGRNSAAPPVSPPRPAAAAVKPAVDAKEFEALAALALAAAKEMAASDLLEGADLSGVLDRETVKGKDIPHA